MQKTSPKQIILGAGGAIGSVLAQELTSRGERVKLVSRTAHTVRGSETAPVDLTDYRALNESVEADATVYLVAGLKYDHRVWQVQWPRIMENCVKVCGAKNARLIFFDNVYIYGRVEGVMTEDSPVNPCSRKGEIRARLAEYLMTEVRKQNVKALIARAADFYGPFAYQSSIPYLFVFEKLLSGKKPQCLISPRTLHSYTYTGDCGKALHLLARSEDAFGQVWHLPTARPALTGEQFIRLAAEEFGAKPGFSIMRKWMLQTAGVFSVTVREVQEMLYQNEFDYLFDSSRFEKKFGLKPTSYGQGIIETIRHLKQSSAGTPQ